MLLASVILDVSYADLTGIIPDKLGESFPKLGECGYAVYSYRMFVSFDIIDHSSSRIS